MTEPKNGVRPVCPRVSPPEFPLPSFPRVSLIPCNVTLEGGGDPNENESAYIWTERLNDTYGNPIPGATVNEYIISSDGSDVITGTATTNGNGLFSDIQGYKNVPLLSGFSGDLQLPTATVNGVVYTLPQINWINMGWTNGTLNYAFPFIP